MATDQSQSWLVIRVSSELAMVLKLTSVSLGFRLRGKGVHPPLLNLHPPPMPPDENHGYAPRFVWQIGYEATR